MREGGRKGGREEGREGGRKEGREGIFPTSSAPDKQKFCRALCMIPASIGRSRRRQSALENTMGYTGTARCEVRIALH